MIFEYFPVGPIGANCYIVGCDETKEAAVVDPGAEDSKILRALSRLGVSAAYIINTHGHLDHIGANGEVKAATGARLLIHRLDAGMLTSAEANLSAFAGQRVTSPAADAFLEDGQVLRVGRVELRVIYTPGHTSGGVCLLATELDDAGRSRALSARRLLTGDTLFAGSVGRTDFPGGSFESLIRSIKEKLMPLGDDVEVYPGHGPSTTIGEEREGNPFLF